jgi:methyl-accepting chemotaxis protein
LRRGAKRRNDEVRAARATSTQAAQGTQVVTGSIMEMKRGATETGTASTHVLGAAQELARHSEDLNEEVDGFLSGIRAA